MNGFDTNQMDAIALGKQKRVFKSSLSLNGTELELGDEEIAMNFNSDVRKV